MSQPHIEVDPINEQKRTQPPQAFSFSPRPTLWTKTPQLNPPALPPHRARVKIGHRDLGNGILRHPNNPEYRKREQSRT